MHCQKIRYIFSALLVGLMVLFAQPSWGQSKAQLERQKAQTEAEINRLNKELSKAKKNTRLNTAQLNALNRKINERTKLIKNINSQLGIIDKQIVHTQDSLNRVRAKVDSMKLEYAKVIRVLYREHDNVDKLVLLFDTPSYNRSYLRLKYFKAYSRYRRRQAQRINQSQQELEMVSNQLIRQRDEKNSLLAQEQRNKSKLAQEEQQQRRNVNAAKANEKNLSTQLSKKEKQRRALDSKIQNIIAEEVTKSRKTKATAKSAPGSSTSKASSAKVAADVAMSNDFSENRGRLGWPVYFNRVLREYGRYTHASGGVNMNNGIDLETNSGAAVYAVFKGVVSRVFVGPNGTSCVIIRHGDFMTVYANLASVSVHQGANVSTKQTIGTVADAGGHGEFSFQIWKERTAQNPRNWLR